MDLMIIHTPIQGLLYTSSLDQLCVTPLLVTFPSLLPPYLFLHSLSPFPPLRVVEKTMTISRRSSRSGWPSLTMTMATRSWQSTTLHTCPYSRSVQTRQATGQLMWYRIDLELKGLTPIASVPYGQELLTPCIANYAD